MRFYGNSIGSMIFSIRHAASHLPAITRFAVFVAIVSCGIAPATAQQQQQQQSLSFEVPKNDSPNAQGLARILRSFYPILNKTKEAFLQTTSNPPVYRA